MGIVLGVMDRVSGIRMMVRHRVRIRTYMHHFRQRDRDRVEAMKNEGSVKCEV